MKKRMKNSTKAKVLSIVSIVLILGCLVLTWMLNDANGLVDEKREEHLTVVEAIEGFRDATVELTINARGYAATGDKSFYDLYQDEINTTKRREYAIEILEKTGMNDEQREHLNELMAISEKLAEAEEEAMALAASGDLEKSRGPVYTDEYVEAARGIRSGIDNFKAETEEAINEHVANIDKWITIFSWLVYISIAVVFLMQVYIIWFVLKELIVPIGKIKDCMVEFAEEGVIGEDIELEENTSEVGMTAVAVHKFQKFQREIIHDIDYLLGEMAEGNFVLKSTCEQNYIGDYENILKSIRTINTNLGDTLSDIYQAAEQVDSGSGQVASGAQALSQGATEQASSIQELSATINDISDKVKDNANNARNANDLSTESTQTIQMCKEKMEDMMTAIREISETSEQISNIIKTIDDIAFQTNVLALNATVEAARAGNAGAGFAVVADEVRNLANKSAVAAKDTAALIQSSIQAVENGTRIAIDTSSALDEIVEKGTLLNNGIEQIAEATNEQATAISQVTQGVDQISAVVQTNSATAEESAAASEELSAQAQMLKSLISSFKLR